VLFAQTRDDAEIVVLKRAPEIAHFPRDQSQPVTKMTRGVIFRFA
jgi:hypothetical protein